MRTRILAPAALAVLPLLAGPRSAAGQTAGYSACYVPDVGALYLIKQPGLPTACLSSTHVEVSWADGGVPDGGITTTQLADGAVTVIKLAFDPATQAEFDAFIADLQAAGTLNASSNPVDWTKLKGVPATFADGTDDNTVYGALANGGLELNATQFSLLRSCADGQVLKWASGAWACADDLSGTSAGGDITDVIAGSGLAGGGTTGSVTLSAAFVAAGGDGGTGTTVSRGDHVHDARYFTETELSGAGTINAAANPVDWTKLKGVPAGFADGTDAVRSINNGSGLQLDGNLLSLLRTCADGQILTWTSPAWACGDLATATGDITDVLAGTGLTGGGTSGSVTLNADLAVAGGDAGSAATIARADHVHDGRYFTETELSGAGTINSAGNPVNWTRLMNVPAGFADGTDNGSVTSVASGAGLTGGPITTTGSLSVDFGGTGSTTKVARSDHTHAAAGGLQSTAVGEGARPGGTGNQGTAVGYHALFSVTSGSGNTAVGARALESNTTGYSNVAVGSVALFQNQTGLENTAIGAQALQNNTGGSSNVAIGSSALSMNTASNSNVAIGSGALYNANGGGSNIGIGTFAGTNVTTGTANIIIGNPGQAADDFTIRIGQSQGATYIAGIANANVTGSAVYVTGDGRLGVMTSSARYKEDIQDLGAASRRVLDLRPVRFRYRPEYDDGSRRVQYGLIAEEVERIFPELVVYGRDGRIQTVRYDLLPVLLLNEVQRQQSEIETLRAELAAQAAAIEALRAELAVGEP